MRGRVGEGATMEPILVEMRIMAKTEKKRLPLCENKRTGLELESINLFCASSCEEDVNGFIYMDACVSPISRINMLQSEQSGWI